MRVDYREIKKQTEQKPTEESVKAQFPTAYRHGNSMVIVIEGVKKRSVEVAKKRKRRWRAEKYVKDEDSL